MALSIGGRRTNDLRLDTPGLRGEGGTGNIVPAAVCEAWRGATGIGDGVEVVVTVVEGSFFKELGSWRPQYVPR